MWEHGMSCKTEDSAASKSAVDNIGLSNPLDTSAYPMILPLPRTCLEKQ